MAPTAFLTLAFLATLSLAAATPVRIGQRFASCDPAVTYEDVLVEMFDNASYPIFRRIVSHDPQMPQPVPELEWVYFNTGSDHFSEVGGGRPELFAAEHARSRYEQIQAFNARREREEKLHETQRAFEAALPEVKAFVRYVLDKVEQSEECELKLDLGVFNAGDDSKIIDVYRPLLKELNTDYSGAIPKESLQAKADAILRDLGYARPFLIAQSVTQDSPIQNWTYFVRWCPRGLNSLELWSIK
jgi:hypothetical protein